uniref:Uncharacterized protein n=1 Tax=Fusarium oxysporum (strain Fo5176) TaxID=660025 RepID=A0A0D2XR84_FUSOF
MIHKTVEQEMRKSSDQPHLRCVAVTRDGRNTNRLRIIGRNEEEIQKIKTTLETRKLQEFNVLPGAMEALSHENGVQIAKVAWLSRKVNPKTYGPMVVYLTKNNDAKRLLQTFSSQVNRHIRVYSSRSLDRNNAVTAKGSVTKHSCAARIEYVQDAPPRATITVSARHRHPNALSAAVRMSHSVEIA